MLTIICNYPDANVILSAHSAARAAQNSPFYAAVQAYTSQETAIYTLDVDGRIGFLFPFDSHFYIAYELMRSAPALVFAELDLNTIFSVLPESLQSGRNALYIMDPAGAVIYENTSNRLQTLLSDGTQRSVLSGQGQHICQSVSSLTGWTFYHTTPAATGMQIFCNALVASLPFSLCLLGLAVLVYLFFKRQVIQPLQGILQQTPVELPQQAENELALLCHAREQLVQQTNSHASMLARMRPEILNQTFSRLLHGDAFDPTETQALLSDLGFQYQFNDRIVVLLLRLPEQQELRNELTTLLPRFVQKIGWDDARTHLLADGPNAYLFLIVHPDESVLSINESCTASLRSALERSRISDVPVCSCICYSLLDLHSVDDYLTEQLSRVPLQAEPPTDASAPYLPAEKKTQAHLKAVAEQIRSGKLTLAQETVLQFLQERLSEDPGLYRNDLIAAWIHQLFLVFSVSEAEAAGIELAQRLGTTEPIPDADCRELLGAGHPAVQRLLSEVAEQVHFGREKAGAGAIQRSDALARLGRRGTRDPSELPEQAVQNQHQSEFYRLFTQLPGPTIPRAAGTRAVSQRSGGTDRFLFPHSHSSAYSKQASAARRGSIENRTSEKKPSLVPLDMRTQVGEAFWGAPCRGGALLRPCFR